MKNKKLYRIIKTPFFSISVIIKCYINSFYSFNTAKHIKLKQQTVLWEFKDNLSLIKSFKKMKKKCFVLNSA